jgi:hypothetical protein
MLLSLILVFFAQAQNNQDPCNESLRTAAIHCNVVQYSCDNISKCISRRDRCVSGVPQTSDACLGLNPCNEPFNRQNDQGSCNYQWDPIRKECSVEPRVFRNTKLCPGRMTGLGSVITQGFEHFHDQNFDCRAVVGYYKKDAHRCNEEISKTLRVCRPNQLTAEFKRHQKLKCPKSVGLVFENPLPDASINDSLRGEETKPNNGQSPSSVAPGAIGL